MPRRRPLTILAVLTCLLAPAAATRAADAPYRPAAERACAAREAAEARLEPDDASVPRQALRFFRGLAAAQRTLVARLAPLRPPDAERAAFGRLVAGERALVPLLDEAVRLLGGGVSTEALERRLYPRIVRATARIDREARRLRLRACAGTG